MAKPPPRKNLSQEVADKRMAEIEELKERVNSEIKEKGVNSSVEVPISDISSPTYHDRRWHDKMAIVELSRSIDSVGLIYPVVLRKVGDKLERIIGYRRIEAYKVLNRQTIPAIILDDVSDEMAILLMTTENLQREDISVYDETLAIIDYIKVALGADAKEVEKLLNRFKNHSTGAIELTSDEKDKRELVAKILKKTGKIDISGLINRLNMLSMHQLIKDALSQSKLSFTNAQILQRLTKDETVLRDALRKVVEENLSKRETMTLVAGLIQPKEERKAENFTKKIKSIDVKKIEKLSADKQKEIQLHIDAILKVIESV